MLVIATEFLRTHFIQLLRLLRVTRVSWRFLFTMLSGNVTKEQKHLSRPPSFQIYYVLKIKAHSFPFITSQKLRHISSAAVSVVINFLLFFRGDTTLSMACNSHEIFMEASSISHNLAFQYWCSIHFRRSKVRGGKASKYYLLILMKFKMIKIW
jgi:hypothetical protein